MITFDASVVCGRCRAAVSGDTARTPEAAQQSAEARAVRQNWARGTMTPAEWLCPRCEAYFLTIKETARPVPSKACRQSGPENIGDSPRGNSPTAEGRAA